MRFRTRRDEPVDSDDWLDLPHAATRAGVSLLEIIRALNAGELAFEVDRRGRTLEVLAGNVDAWVVRGR